MEPGYRADTELWKIHTKIKLYKNDTKSKYNNNWQCCSLYCSGLCLVGLPWWWYEVRAGVGTVVVTSSLTVVNITSERSQAALSVWSLSEILWHFWFLPVLNSVFELIVKNASNQITMNSWSGNLYSSETYISEPYCESETLWYPVMWFSVMLWNLEEMVTAQFLPLKASQILGSRNHPRLYLTSISLHARHNVLQIITVICWQRWLTWIFYLNFSVIL